MSKNLIIILILLLALGAGAGIYYSQKGKAPATEPITEEKLKKVLEEIETAEVTEGPAITYCPQKNLPEGWSVKIMYPVDTSPSVHLKIDNILPIKTQSVAYSIVGEEPSRLCMVREYSTIDEAKKVFNIKKMRL